MGTEFLAEIFVFGVLHHTHDLEYRFRLVRRGFAANSQSNRVSALSKPPRELLVDDRDLRGVGGVLLVEVPPGQKRCAERFEIAAAGPVEIRVESRLAILAIGPNPVICARAAQRNDANFRCSLNAGDARAAGRRSPSSPPGGVQQGGGAGTGRAEQSGCCLRENPRQR